MLYKEYVTIRNISIHKVGNKLNQDEVIFSKMPLSLNENLNKILINYCLSPFFNSSEYFKFYHDIDISMNEVFICVNKIFDEPKNFHEQSVNLAKHLYEQSTHPKIKGGEFYVVHFKDCIVDGETVDAIGLFKSENKDTFLKVYPSKDGFEVESQQGVNINKLDKGALIFNIDRENGYIVSIVDNTNKGTEAHYWVDDFLHIRHRKDSYNQTQNMLSLCKSFISQFSEDKGKVDKAILINRSVEALKNESINIDSFAENVFEHPELVSKFKKFKDSYQKERDIEIDDTFDTAPEVLKRKGTGTMTTIRLDKNFDINIHGGEQYIERGYDEKRGMHYYQLFFKDEK